MLNGSQRLLGREEQLAAKVVAYLRDLGWTVYQEVTLGGPRADIVAVRKPLVWIVECKQHFGLDVLAQAWEWRSRAHYVSIATAPGKRRHGQFARQILRDYGIGHLDVSYGVTEYAEPCFCRRAKVGPLLDRLRPEHETYAPAGNARGDYYSPFRATCKEVLAHVRSHPGCSVRELVDAIRHHYQTPASARTSLLHWIETGKVPGVVLRRDGKRITLHAEADPA